MIKQEEVYRIGRLGKAHGVKGEVSFQFDDDIFDQIDADYLVLDIEGILVPFFMEEYRFRNDSVCLVKFCDIDTQQQASELTGCDVYFPRALADEADTVPWLLAALPTLTTRLPTSCLNWRTVDSSPPMTTSSQTST